MAAAPAAEAGEATRFRPLDRPLGRYEVVSHLGTGSFGEVYLARDLLTSGTRVALKSIRPEIYGAEAQAYLRREYEAIRTFRHPWVVRARDYDILPDGSGLLVLDYLEGEDLSQDACPELPAGTVLDGIERGPLETLEPATPLPSEVLRGLVAVACLLDVLEYIHGRGWVHYDMKPRNVRVLPDGRIVLIDFHLSAREGEPIEAGLRGTVGYMAPEIITGRAPVADRRADLYGVGVMLHEILGRRPLYPGSGATLLKAHVLEPPPPLADRDGRPLPQAIDRVARKLLAKNVEDRYPHAAAALGDLADALGARIRLPDPGRYRDLLAPPLVGRESELARVRDILSPGTGPLARPSTVPRAVLIRGKPGVGKSRFLREVAAAWTTDGGLLIRGSGDTRGREVFGPLREDLRGLELRARAAADTLGETAARKIEEILQRLSAPAYETVPAGEVERASLVEEMADALRLAARDRPLLVAVDDLDRADEATIALYAFIARSGGPQRAIATMGGALAAAGGKERAKERAPEGHAWERVIASLVRTGAIEDVRLAPLAPESTAELLAQALGRQAVPPWLVERIHEASEGAPAAAREALVTLAAQGAIIRRRGRFVVDPAAAEKARLPSGVREALLDRLASVRDRPDLAPVLAALAVLGRPAPLALVARLAARSEEEVLEAARTLREAGLALRTDREQAATPAGEEAGASGVEIGPAHRSLAEHILLGLPEGQRTELHERAARLIEESCRFREDRAPSGAQLLELADHCLLGGRRADGRSFLFMAADAFARDLQSYAAGDAFRRLLREVGDGADVLPEDRRRRLEARIRLAALLRESGRVDEALQELERARRTDGAALDGTLRADLFREEGVSHFRRGRLDQAETAFREGLATATGHERATLLSRLADLHLWQAAYAKAAEAADEAVAIYRGEGREDEAVLAYNALYFSHLFRGDDDRAKEFLERSLTHSRRHERLYQTQRARAGAPASDPSEFGDALETLSEGAMPLGEQGGTPLFTGNLSAAFAYGGKGRWETYHRRRLALLEAIGAGVELAFALSNLGIVEKARGDYAAARSAFERARDLHGSAGNRQGVALALQNIATLDLEYGRYDEASRTADRAVEIAAAVGMRWLPGYARQIQGTAAFRTGNRLGAEASYADALRIFRELGNRRAQDELALDLAAMHIAAGAPDDAARVLARIEEERPSPVPPSIPRELAWAELDLLREAPERARDRLRKAERAPEAEEIACDLAWQIQYALARAQDDLGEWEGALGAYVRAMEIVRGVWDRTPDGVRTSYLKDPRREALRRSFDAFKSGGGRC